MQPHTRYIEKDGPAKALQSIRKLAHRFFLFNLPLTIIGMISMYGIPLVIPGMILLNGYWRIAKGRYSLKKSQQLWKRTLKFNAFLLILFLILISLFAFHIPEMAWYGFACIPPIVGILVSRYCLNLLEKNFTLHMLK